ncbi:MAG: hypothetical protein ACYTGQ_12810 [Planctomycetota bacterium]
MQINVGPFTYEIRIHPGSIPHEGEECFGLCDNLAQVLYISDRLPPRQRLQVFFHELMHAWWYHFGLNVDDEESVVDLVGMAMTDFMIEAARCMKRQTSNQTAEDPVTGDDAFMRFIEPGVAPVRREQTMHFAGLAMLGGPANTPRREGVGRVEGAVDRGSVVEGDTPKPASGSGEAIRGKANRLTHVYEPTAKLNPLTPIHAIRHGEWVVRVYDSEEEDFVA